MAKESITKLGIVLMLICLLAGLALAFAYNVTRARIEEEARRKQRESLKIVLPSAIRFSDEQVGREMNFYTGFDGEGKVVGYAFPGEAKGYSSVVRVMVGIDPGGTITGINVTEQKETPGLGDKVDQVPVRENLWQALAGASKRGEPERPPFQAQFIGKALSDLKVVVGPTTQNVQAITGATITSRAVTQAVRQSIEVFLDQRNELSETSGRGEGENR